jgi:hypothetical protein
MFVKKRAWQNFRPIFPQPVTKHLSGSRVCNNIIVGAQNFHQVSLNREQ